MRADEPALFDSGQWSRLGNDCVGVFRMMNVPEGGGEVRAMLIDSQRVVTVENMDAQSCLEVVEGSAADAGNIPSRQADGADGIPHADHLHVGWLRVFEQPPLLLGQLAGFSSSLHIPQFPDGL